MPKYILFLCCFVISLTACQKPESPIFKNIENLRVKKANLKRVILEGDVVLHNPNNFACNIKSTDIKVWINNRAAGTINQDVKTIIGAMGDTRIPVKFNCATDSLFQKKGLLDNILSVISKKEVDARFKGKVVLDVGGIGIPVPINHQESLLIKF